MWDKSVLLLAARPLLRMIKIKDTKKPTVRSVLLEKRVDDTEEELGQAFEERDGT